MRALVIGASGGIGGAVADALATQGEVLRLSRSRNGFDIADEASVQAQLSKLEGSLDLIFVASGVLGTPEKTLRALAAPELAAQMAVNTLGPLLVLKHALRLMPRDRRCAFVALSARVGSIGDNALGGWYSYRAAKAALNQMLHTAAIEVARSHKQALVVGLHPGTVDTPFTAGYGHDKLTPAQSAERMLAVVAGLRPDQTGGFFDQHGDAVPW